MEIFIQSATSIGQKKLEIATSIGQNMIRTRNYPLLQQA
jgi:hypothetical protein